MDFPRSVDIFCRVVDNFGDIGVCWRLAYQFAKEHSLSVRLYVDDLGSLERIVPDYSALCSASFYVVRWVDDLDYSNAADVVIEAFACDLPPNVIEAIVRRGGEAAWIDLEYLTAEGWAAGCHGIPSTHPSTGLKKSMFFPGFSETSGGLIRETDLFERRNEFQSDINAQNLWRTAYDLPQFDENFIDISLFSYKSAPIPSFFDDLSSYKSPVRVFFPSNEGFCVEKIGALHVHRIPFVPQDQFDYLLWTCDVNFVRGEDSFVRAQFAGRPMIWNIYVQEEDAHLIKLRAFLDLYCAAFSPEERERLAESFKLWNQEGQTEVGWWHGYLDRLPAFQSGAAVWSDHLFGQPDLAHRLLAYAYNNNILKNKG
ncbi:MAG: elongation factor P maturation arginine rhamnosyltransferase EarP [Pseudobdellovibrionaceae bacterium]|jgi:uncharacterized repeat protein (TIGR03837 family)|nr:elongation factor P maturation arginine rhamnosyltransferase EarP [Pseudobdellovibrionaceae bacterium]